MNHYLYRTALMRTPASIGILILNSLCVCVRPYDFSISNPLKPDVSIYPQICFMDIKPFYCPKVSPRLDPANMPYAIQAGRQRQRYNSYRTNARPYIDPSFVFLKGTLDNDLRRRPPIYYSPQTYLQSSVKHAPNPDIHRSFLYNSLPLEHGKNNYEVTTVETEIKPSSDYSILTSRSDVVAVSESTTAVPFVKVPERSSDTPANVSLFDKFTQSLDRFERKFYQITFIKLLSISPPGHLVNGISFAQSGLFLYLALTALSTEVDSVSSAEIDRYLHLQLSDSGKIKLLNQIVSWLPTSSVNLKFRWATRLVLEAGLPVTQKFRQGSAPALKLQVEWLNGTETLGNLTKTLNSRVKTDSGGAMRNTFEEDDFSEGACSILLNTLYFRARWRSPPTVLNGSRPFHDSELTQPQRSVRMIRINDVMRYADIEEWNAEMGISRLVETNNAKTSGCGELRLSHAVQRIMFWAEAGRNAYKDDGIEWDETPEKEIIVDRPYLFFVRWKNVTLMNGNFAL
ncbi:uncharacterized protein LOC120623300 isoform X2 [Pararge aegeria]|uniref:uncharacterized protein LOC120623300 isoform X2 n=1 Tax=Pararge aegeria TaxID=116150 RepID=UPI0019D316FE|nr:uncharacterized protein LOC120623300 isoform X2 [Pararge aegeria]